MGIPPADWSRGRAGHYGLPSMRYALGKIPASVLDFKEEYAACDPKLWNFDCVFGTRDHENGEPSAWISTVVERHAVMPD